jgi:hypothetical protein
MSEDHWNRANLASEAEVPPCIACRNATLATAEMDFEGRISPIAMCDDCQALAARFGVGEPAQRRSSIGWPRFGWSETMLCFAWGEAEGRMLTLSWGALHLEFTVAWGRP